MTTSRFWRPQAMELVLAVVVAVWIVAWIAPRPTPTPEPEPIDVTPLLEGLLFRLRPADFGVREWRPGLYAEYELTELSRSPGATGDVKRRVRVEVLRRAAPDDVYCAEFGGGGSERYWLRFRSLRVFRDRPVDVYRLTRREDLRVTAATPLLESTRRYFPVFDGRHDEPPLELEVVGEENVTAGGREILCRKLVARGPEPRVAIWVHANAAPLGVVAMCVAGDSLELVTTGEGAPPRPAESIAPLVDGTATLTRDCHSCHGDNCREILAPPR